VIKTFGLPSKTLVLRASAEISRRRNNYKTSYGYGISRVPRKILSSKGNRFSWVGAVAPGTVGGRRAHPPKADKNLVKDINKKEKKKALRCAISATILPEVVSLKHKVPKNYPFVLADDIESMAKTSDLLKLLNSLGLTEELNRISDKKIRAGKGTLRNRKYKRKVGPLLVVSKDCPVEKVLNIPGVDVVKVDELNALELAPGMEAGRMTLFTESALKKMKEDKLFL